MRSNQTLSSDKKKNYFCLKRFVMEKSPAQFPFFLWKLFLTKMQLRYMIVEKYQIEEYRVIRLCHGKFMFAEFFPLNVELQGETA